jgi:hypothetical protein
MHGLLFKIDVVVGRFYNHLVRPVPGSHLKHPDSTEIYLGEDPKGRELIWDNAGHPAGAVWLAAVVANAKDFGRRHLFVSVAERAARPRFGALFFASRFGRFGPLRSRR